MTGAPAVADSPAPVSSARANIVFATVALGLLMADFRYDFSATNRGPLEPAEAERITRLYTDLEREAVEQMTRDGVAPEKIALVRTAEVRYERQGFELEVMVPGGPLDSVSLEQVREAFHTTHQRHYGYAMRGEALLLVNAQVTAVAQLPKPEPIRMATCTGRTSAAAIKDRRPMYADGRWAVAAVYDRALLECDVTIEGPAIV